MNSVLLTVDLTKAVADEAIERNDCVVVAYRMIHPSSLGCQLIIPIDPIIFRGLKSLTLADTQQQSLLRLALEGISVYCPHTAVDAAPGGLGDWLADIVTGKLSEPEPETQTADTDVPQITQQDSAPTSNESKGSPETDPFVSAASSSEALRPPLPPRFYMQRQYSNPTYPIHQKDEKEELTLFVSNLFNFS
jgi:putative NIF3 family GTP cyclohydrolase 1 type 2